MPLQQVRLFLDQDAIRMMKLLIDATEYAVVVTITLVEAFASAAV